MNGENTLIETLRRHYRLLSFGAFLLFVLFFFSQYAFVTVTVVGDRAAQAKIELYDGTRKASELRRGLNFVKRGDFSLRASTDNALSERYVELKAFRMNRSEIEIDAQRGIQKVMSGSLGCVFAEKDIQTDTTVLSYPCGASNRVIKYSFVDIPTTAPAFEKQIYNGTPYRGGLLGFVGGFGGEEELFLSLVTGTGAQKLPYHINAEADLSKYSIQVSTDSNGRLQESFVLADGDKRELVYFKNLSDPSPQKLPMPEGEKIQYSVVDGTMFVVNPQPQQNEKTGERVEDFGGGKLKQYSISGDFKETASLDIPKDIDLFDARALNQETLATRTLSGETIIYRVRDSKIEVIDRIQVTDDLVPHKDGFVYRKNNDYLRYDVNKRLSKLVYRLGNLSPSTMQNSDGRIVVSAFVPNSSIQYSFVLLDSPRGDDAIFKVLSYPAEDKSVRNLDFNDRIIYVEFALTSFTSDRQTGISGYDPQELVDKKKKLTDKLTADGIDTSKYTIVNR